MPLYDCGAPDCEECQREFGPDRAKAIAAFERRMEFFAGVVPSQPSAYRPRSIVQEQYEAAWRVKQNLR